MSGLNQYEISRILGSKMKPVKAARFGNLPLLETTTEATKAAEIVGRESEDAQKFGYEEDRVVVQAFENARNGASTDALLWDRELLSRFVRECRDLGLDASASFLNRRLINVRKSKSRYEKKGIVLSPTTRKEPKPSIVSEYAPVVEFALVRLRYQFGASIDDLLLDLQLCGEFERLAQSIAPQLSGEDLRRAALYIRKTRFIKKNEEQDIRSLRLDLITNELSNPVPLDEVDISTVPDSPGLLEVDEVARHLYIVQVGSLRPLARELVDGKPFEIVASPFWQPDRHQITIRFAEGLKIGGVSVQKWEHRLICEHEPLFNWPMSKNHKLAV